MKRIANVIVAVALVGLLSQSAFAFNGGPAPDACSTVALLSLAIGGLAALKRFMR